VKIRSPKWIGALVAAVRAALRALGGLSAIARPELCTLSPLAGLGRRPRRSFDDDGGSR
jgi:hypothetical protein